MSSTRKVEGHVMKTLKKSLQFESQWDEKDDYLDVIYWMRQIFAILNGVAWGLVPFQGIVGIASFLAINFLIVYIYSSKVQKVDDEEFGGVQEILKEGLFTAFAVYMISWIVVYTALHSSSL